VSLEPRSSAGFRLRGWIQYARGLIQDAVRSLKAALEIDPNDADTLLLLCNCYLISGKVPAARPLIDRVMPLDPLTPLTRCLPGFADVSEGRFESVELYRLMFDMDPGNPMARLFYLWILALNGRQEAVAAVLEGFSPADRKTVPARLAQFLAYALFRRRQDALRAVTPEIEAVATASDVFARFLAEGYAVAGACDALARDRGRSRLHQLSIPGSVRSVPRDTAKGSTVRAAAGDCTRALAQVRSVINDGARPPTSTARGTWPSGTA
jgi:tetratricopeptide (TPR) repeat protein